jgi:hypothetical protein
MAEQIQASRFFIQIDPTHRHANIARWVELSLTNEFVRRVQEMHGLLDEHHLQLVTAEFKAKWCLVEGWEVRSQSGGQDTWLDVLPEGFTVKSHVVRAGESNLPRAQSYSIDASYIWGDIDQFVSDFQVDNADEPYDRLDTAQGISDYAPGDPDWEIAFAHELDTHLAVTCDQPLHLHEAVAERCFGEALTSPSNESK